MEDFNITANSSDLLDNYKIGFILEDFKAVKIVLIILSAVIVILNGKVVLHLSCILYKETEPKATYLFLGNISIVDFLTGCGLLFGQIYPAEKIEIKGCAIYTGLIVSGILISVYSVGLIAIDRFIYILHGLKYKDWMSPCRTYTMILFTWFLGLFVGACPIYHEHNKDEVCWYLNTITPNMLFLVAFLILIPIITVFILYVTILYYALTKVIQLRRSKTPQGDYSNGIRMFQGRTMSIGSSDNTNNNSRKKPYSPSKWRAIIVVFLTTGSFTLFWMPYLIASCVHASCNRYQTPEKCRYLNVAIAAPLLILGYMNSILNPIIYHWWHTGFRNHVKQVCSHTETFVKLFTNHVIINLPYNRAKVVT